MKILMLSDINSIHTRRWVQGLLSQGCVIHLFSLTQPVDQWHQDWEGLSLIEFEGISTAYAKKPAWQKWQYLRAIKLVKQAIQKIQPEVVHAHYASSYGLIGARSKGTIPLIISVWGDEVLFDARRSVLFRSLLKQNFQAADKVLATSEMLADATRELTDTEVEVVPFGVDMDKFKVALKSSSPYVIGLVKTLEEGYAVDILIRAYARVRELLPNESMELRVYGDGSMKEELEELIRKLGVSDSAQIMGLIDHDSVPQALSEMTIFCCLPRHEESFGVAIVEAMACGLPVIVSDRGALPEVTDYGQAGVVVESENVEAAAMAMRDLLMDAERRLALGVKAREKVKRAYDWTKCVEQTMTCLQALQLHS